MDPGCEPIQLFSHKVLRRLVAVPLLVLLVTSVVLWSEGAVYRGVAASQLMLYGCAALGVALSGTRLDRVKLLTLPLFFVAVNVAALMGAFNLLFGQRVVMWSPKRQDELKVQSAK